MTATLFAHGCERVALTSVSTSLYRTEEHDQAEEYYRCLSEHGVRLDKNLVLEGRTGRRASWRRRGGGRETTLR